MPDTTTPNLGLTKMQPGTHRDTWGDVFNDNLDAIDAAVDAVKDTADAALPKAGGTVAGAIVREGQGAHAHWGDDALGAATMFLAPEAGASPLTLPGQIWFGYSA